jgi:SAM-dependent methyltransferase
MDLIHDSHFWSERYKTGNTGWDIGRASTPLSAYFDQLESKQIKILIPGAGHAWEAEYLHYNGFTDVWVVDIAPEAIDNFKKRVPDFPSEHLICGNFFDVEDTFDRIIEQTFFCALHPSERERYCVRTSQLLKSNGKLVGLLFDEPLNATHPPYGGSQQEYRELFAPYYEFEVFSTAYNSITPRERRELFIILRKRSSK